MDDMYLTRLSEGLGKEWIFLATAFLDFTDQEVQHIENDHPLAMVDQISTMLVRWRQRQPQKEIKKAVTTLADGLIGCHRRDLAERVQQRKEN